MRRMTRLGLGFPKNAASSSSFPRLGHWRFSIRTGLHVEHFKTAPSTAPTRDESSPIKHGSRQSYGSVHTRSHGILWTWVGEKSQNEKKRSLRKRKREVAAVLRRLHRAQSQRLLLGDFEPRLRLLIPAAWAAGIPSV